MSTPRERQIWMNEGTEQYRYRLEDKIGYGFKAEDLIKKWRPCDVLFYEPSEYITEEAQRLHKRQNSKRTK